MSTATVTPEVVVGAPASTTPVTLTPAAIVKRSAAPLARLGHPTLLGGSAELPAIAGREHSPSGSLLSLSAERVLGRAWLADQPTSPLSHP